MSIYDNWKARDKRQEDAEDVREAALQWFEDHFDTDDKTGFVVDDPPEEDIIAMYIDYMEACRDRHFDMMLDASYDRRWDGA